MKPDKSGFQLVSVPAKPEVVEEATTKGPPCSCCHPGAEHAHEELPGPPANPPKQHRSRGKPESQPQENGTHASGKATAGSGMAAASSVPDLAQEVSDMSCPLCASIRLSICVHRHCWSGRQASPGVYQDIYWDVVSGKACTQACRSVRCPFSLFICNTLR